MMRTRSLPRIARITLLLGATACGSTEPSSVASVAIDQTAPSIMVGQQIRLTATARDGQGNVLSKTISWSSLATNIATVDATGTVIGVSPGTAEVVATAGGVSGQTSVAVAAPPHLVASPTSVTLSSVGGAAAPPVTVQISNGGGGALSGLAEAVQYTGTTTGWLAVSLNTSTFPATLTVQSAAGLASGTYTANVLVSAASADNSPLLLPVSLTVTPNYPLTVAASGSGSGEVTATPAGTNGSLDCIVTNGVTSGTCAANYATNTTVSLRAVAGGTSSFVGWSGACSSTGSLCVVSMTSAQSVVATFTKTGALPIIATAPADSITGSSARLNGTVTQDGNPYTVWFELSTSPTLATYTASSTGSGPDATCPGTSVCDWEDTWSALSPATTYYYRIAASNAAGTSRGSIQSFTTAGGGVAPVIVSPSVVVLSLNSCNSGDVLAGSSFHFMFSFFDTDGDVAFVGTPLTVSWRFAPSGSSGSSDWSVSSYTGNGANGTITAAACVSFVNDTSVNETFALRDEAGHTSNALTVHVSRPQGADAARPGARASIAPIGVPLGGEANRTAPAWSFTRPKPSAVSKRPER